MKRPARGLIAAFAVSLAGHAAVVMALWPGAPSGPGAPLAPTVIVARLLDSGKPEPPATTTAEGTPAIPDPNQERPVEPRSEASALSELPLPLDETAKVPAQAEAKTAVAPVTPPALSEDASRAAQPRQDTTDGRMSAAVPAMGPSSDVDRGPHPLDDIQPDFPAAAGTRGGVVTLRLLISDQGVVESVEVVRSSPPGLFDAAAIAAFGHARFAPGLRSGVPVRSEVMYEVNFAPLGSGRETSGRTY